MHVYRTRQHAGHDSLNDVDLFHQRVTHVSAPQGVIDSIETAPERVSQPVGADLGHCIFMTFHVWIIKKKRQGREKYNNQVVGRGNREQRREKEQRGGREEGRRGRRERGERKGRQGEEGRRDIERI